jgi:hypothetical protein
MVAAQLQLLLLVLLVLGIRQVCRHSLAGAVRWEVAAAAAGG